MPLDKGYGKERLRIDIEGKARPEIDPRIPPVPGTKVDPSMTPGQNLDPSIHGERVKDLKKKFFPGVE